MRLAKLMLVAVAASALLASCGSKMTEEQINAKVDEQFNAQSATLTADLEEQCNNTFDGLVKNATDSIVAAKVAEAQAAMATPPAPAN